MARGFARLEGLRECRESMRNLSRAVERNVGKRSLAKGGAVITSRLSAAMPVSSDPYNPTKGSLKAAPKTVPAKTEKGSPRIAVLIEDDAAAPGEFGTSKMAPHLKVRSTVDTARDDAGQAIAEGLIEEVGAAVRRSAKRGQ